MIGPCALCSDPGSNRWRCAGCRRYVCGACLDAVAGLCGDCIGRGDGLPAIEAAELGADLVEARPPKKPTRQELEARTRRHRDTPPARPDRL